MARESRKAKRTMSAGDGRPGNPTVKMVTRVTDVLSALAGYGADGAALADIARDTGLNKPTTHRLLLALTDLGFVFQETVHRTYHLGQKTVELGMTAFETTIAAAAAPSIAKLAETTGDTAFALAREGSSSICVGRVVGSFPLRTLTLEVGDRWPLGLGAAGLALLSALPDSEIERILVRNQSWLDQFGVPADDLRQGAVKAKRDGYATNEGNFVSGMNALGVALRDAAGRPFAALSIAAISPRLPRARMQDLAVVLKAEADQVLLRLDIPSETAGHRRQTSAARPRKVQQAR